MTASPQLCVSTSGHAGDRAALRQEPALPGAPETHLAQAEPLRSTAALPPSRQATALGARRSSREEAVLPSERLRFRLRCRHFAVRQQRSGPAMLSTAAYGYGPSRPEMGYGLEAPVQRYRFSPYTFNGG